MSVLEEARLSRKSPVGNVTVPSMPKCLYMHMRVACLLHVAVAVSGGCDSMVLLWMAKQAFTDLTSVTVDLR